MPCDSIYSISLDTSGMDIGAMKRMLERLGHRVTQYGDLLQGTWGSLNMRTGSLTGRTLTEEQVVMGYAEQTVLETCEEYGWEAERIGKWEYEIVKA